MNSLKALFDNSSFTLLVGNVGFQGSFFKTLPTKRDFLSFKRAADSLI